MREKQKLLIYSVIFYACSSANIYLAVRFLLAGEYVYPILFWILFGFDKMIAIIDMKNCLLSLADFFQLGTFYLLCDSYPYLSLGSYSLILLCRVLPLLFIQSICYFGGDLLSNPLISSQDAFLAYLMFLAYIIFAIICLNESFSKSPFY